MLLNCGAGEDSWESLGIFIGGTDAEAETLILWTPGGNNWLFCKGSDAGKNLKLEGKGMTVDEMVGWHHQLNEHEFE